MLTYRSMCRPNVGMGLTRPGKLDERLQRVENELSELPGKTKKAAFGNALSLVDKLST